MSFSLLSKKASSSSVGCASRPARSQRSVRVMTFIDDGPYLSQADVSARNWIENWKSKQASSAGRPSWFPGSPLPDHLDGSLAGDHGFDPLGLAVEPFKLRWYVQAELQNGRWAMLGVAGILGQELIGSLGLGGPAASIAWFDHAKFEYYAPIPALFMVQMALFAWAEINRVPAMRGCVPLCSAGSYNAGWLQGYASPGGTNQDYVNPGSVNQDPIFSNNKLAKNSFGTGYPGFDPLGFSKGDMVKLKLNEIKNARLAMVAFAGIIAQAYTTGKTPLANLGEHLADPWGTTVWQNDLARL